MSVMQRKVPTCLTRGSFKYASPTAGSLEISLRLMSDIGCTENELGHVRWLSLAPVSSHMAWRGVLGLSGKEKDQTISLRSASESLDGAENTPGCNDPSKKLAHALQTPLDRLASPNLRPLAHHPSCHGLHANDPNPSNTNTRWSIRLRNPAIAIVAAILCVCNARCAR